MHGILEISVLGGVAVRRGGSPVAAVPLRAIGLLAYLAVNADIPQSRPHLAGMFWPDSSDAQARTNLRRELHQLRGLLDGDACLVVDASTLAWRSTDTCRVDVCRLALERDAALDAQSRGDVDALARHCEAALAEYRGPLLTGWYDDWVLAARDVLHRQCIDLCDRAVRAAKETWQGSRRGSWALLLARRRIQLAPFEEPGYRELMDLQALSGDRAGAMTTYHRCASVLEQELGVSPSEATSRAIEDIIGDPGLVVGDAGSMPARVASRATGRPSLIGRDDELAELQSRWARAAAGNPGLAIVSGEAGVGKSRLVAELARVSAKHGALVATARCFGASGGLALAPVADWLRSPQLRASRTSLEPVWREEVDRLVPHPSTGVGGSAASRAKVDAWQRLRFFEGLGRAALAAERPTLLVLDDLQWCDNDTMLWLSFLFGLEPRAPLLVACSARGEELADNRDVYASLRSLRSAGLVMELELGPLAPAETARVAAQMTGDWLSAADVALLQSATGGYPLYVVEAIRAQPTGGAAAALTDRDVNRVLHDRPPGKPPPDAARAITGLAAAIGRDFSLELLSQASDLDADSVVRAVDELWAAPNPASGGAELRLLARAASPGGVRRSAARPTVAAPPASRPGDRGGQCRTTGRCRRRSWPTTTPAADWPTRAVPFYARAAEVATGVYAHAEAIRLLRLSLGLL